MCMWMRATKRKHSPSIISVEHNSFGSMEKERDHKTSNRRVGNQKGVLLRWSNGIKGFQSRGNRLEEKHSSSKLFLLELKCSFILFLTKMKLSLQKMTSDLPWVSPMKGQLSMNLSSTIRSPHASSSSESLSKTREIQLPTALCWCNVIN